MKYLIIILFGIIVLQVIPGGQSQFLKYKIRGDGSCLFSALQYAIWNYEPQTARANETLRRQAGERVQKNPELFEHDLVDFGISADDYPAFIMNEENWGGAIDALATALDYETEISIVSLPMKTVQTFGKGKGFPDRVFLLYDGSHYDALYQKIPVAQDSDSSDSDDEIKYKIVTVFETDDPLSYKEAERIAESGVWEDPEEIFKKLSLRKK